MSLLRTMGRLLAIVFLPLGASAATARITPFIGQPEKQECRSVELTRANARGLLLVPEDDGQTVSARVLYGKESTVKLRMMTEDAQTLRSEVDHLMRGLRKKPIRIRAGAGRSGDCEVEQVSG